MVEESASTAWANWTTVVRNLIELPFLVFAFRYYRRHLDARRELCKRIGAKYYSCMESVESARKEARNVTQDSMEHLRTVNRWLAIFNLRLSGTTNIGGSGDIEIGEIREVFSHRAAEIMQRMGELLGEFAGLEKASWKDVCASDVIKCADRILREWDALLRIMARKRHIGVSSLRREYREQSAGE